MDANLEYRMALNLAIFCVWMGRHERLNLGVSFSIYDANKNCKFKMNVEKYL